MVTLLNGGLSYRMGLQDLMKLWDTSAGENTMSKQNEPGEEATSPLKLPKLEETVNPKSGPS